MKLKKILGDIPCTIHGKQDVEITGICSNSKIVGPGHLFIAKKGRKHDGQDFISEAVSSGAVAVITDLFNPFLETITQIIHHNPASLEALIAARFHDHPSQKLLTIGVTGTNGKTTTTSLIHYLLNRCGISTSLIGTLCYIVGSIRWAAQHTTPQPSTLQKLLAETVIQKCQAVVMEVSSHGLEQGRVNEVSFDIAAFTQLSSEHLDYHQTMERYAASKAKLFRELLAEKKKGINEQGVGVYNSDCPWTSEMMRGARGKSFLYGIDRPADLVAKDIELTDQGTTFTLQFKDWQQRVKVPIVGRFNIYNVLCACAVVMHAGIPLEQIVTLLKDLPQIPGRLQRIQTALDFPIYVDYAHTTDSLSNLLQTLRGLVKGKLIVVFGCGGDRDKTKRPQMGAVAERYADSCFITSDNPRTEDPAKICQEIAGGFSPQMNPDRYSIEVCRKTAIAKAIASAQSGDCVVIAGKGHETTQEFAHRTLPFDDAKVALETSIKNRP